MPKTYLYNGKVVTASSNVIKDTDTLIGYLYDLKDEIKKFEDSYDFVDKFVKMNRGFISKVKVVSKLNSDVASITWEITNKRKENGTFSIILSKGLESSVSYVANDGEDVVKTIARNVFMQKLYNFIKIL